MQDNSVKFTVEEIGSKYAVLKCNDSKIGTILWPLEKLPAEPEIGATVDIGVNISSGKQHPDKEYEVMRKLLQDLVN